MKKNRVKQGVAQTGLRIVHHIREGGGASCNCYSTEKVLVITDTTQAPSTLMEYNLLGHLVIYSGPKL